VLGTDDPLFFTRASDLMRFGIYAGQIEFNHVLSLQYKVLRSGAAPLSDEMLYEMAQMSLHVRF
jgi:hypothetical protein